MEAEFMIPKTIPITLCYIQNHEPCIIILQLPQDSQLVVVLEEAINLGLLSDTLNYYKGRVGIWGVVSSFNTLLKIGDRVEIYAPLMRDPKEARRLRASTKTILSMKNIMISD